MTVPRVTEAKWTPQCMTPAELDAWMDMARRVSKGARRPCVDCPAAHAAEMRSAGCCNGYVRHPSSASETYRRRNAAAVRRYRMRQAHA